MKSIPPANAGSRGRPSASSQRNARSAGAGVGQEDEGVPAADRAEQPLERPEREPERPSGEIDALLHRRLEAVRVEPWRGRTLELVAGEPELVRGLQVVARSRLAVPREPLGHEALVRVANRRPGGEHARREVRGDR